MGTWGVELFSDDTAADVRAHYRELIEDAEATQHVPENFQEYLDDEDDGPVVWLALAVSQSQIGRLAPEVRDKALGVIEAGADLERWSHDPQKLEQRGVVVTKVTRLDPDRNSIAPIVKVLRYAATVEPAAEQIAILPDRRKPDIDPPPSRSPPWWSVDWRPEGDAGIDYAEAGFRRLTNIGPKPGDENARAWTFGVLVELRELPGMGLQDSPAVVAFELRDFSSAPERAD